MSELWGTEKISKCLCRQALNSSKEQAETLMDRVYNIIVGISLALGSNFGLEPY